MNVENIALVLGIVAIVVSTASMVFKKKPMIMLFCTIYNVLTLISYLLLGKYLGSILVGVLTIKSFIYYLFALKSKKPNIIILIMLEVAIIALSIILWQGWVDTFILCNSIINTYVAWQDNVDVLKFGVVICSIFLILYDAFIGAYIYIVSEVAYGGVALITLIINKRRSKKDETITNKAS